MQTSIDVMVTLKVPEPFYTSNQTVTLTEKFLFPEM